MLNIKKIETIMSLILSIGMIIGVSLGILGGSMYLFQHGSEDIYFELAQPNVYSTNLFLIWNAALSFSPLGIIQLGLITLVASQIIRVILLVWFYGAIRDYWFFFISLFVVTVLIYSFFFP